MTDSTQEKCSTCLNPLGKDGKCHNPSCPTNR